jgi:hypothetical protein
VNQLNGRLAYGADENVQQVLAYGHDLNTIVPERAAAIALQHPTWNHVRV